MLKAKKFSTLSSPMTVEGFSQSGVWSLDVVDPDSLLQAAGNVFRMKDEGQARGRRETEFVNGSTREQGLFIPALTSLANRNS